MISVDIQGRRARRCCFIGRTPPQTRRARGDEDEDKNSEPTHISQKNIPMTTVHIPYNGGAEADSVAVEDIASCDQNAALLRRLRDGDPTLTSISVRSMSIGRNDYVPAPGEDLGWLGHYVGVNARLTGLSVSGDGISREQLRSLCAGVGSNRSIQWLRLFRVDLAGGDIFGMLGSFLREHLVELNVVDCNFGAAGSISLSGALRRGGGESGNLRSVALERNAEQVDDNKGVTDIIVALSKYHRLEKLSLNGVQLGYDGWCALASLMELTAASLKELCLGSAGIDDEALEILMPAVARSKKMRTLSLDGNPAITARGWDEVTALIEDSECSLETISVQSCGIDDEEAAVFALSVAHDDCKLKTLRLDNNNITEKGWQRFAVKVEDFSFTDVPFCASFGHLPALRKGVQA